jgi:hypothetical protein
VACAECLKRGDSVIDRRKFRRGLISLGLEFG